MATISVRTEYIASAEAGMPGLAVQITRLVDSYMVWVGSTDETAETVENAPRSGSLCKDWACAMPPAAGSTVSAYNEKKATTERGAVRRTGDDAVSHVGL